ncbi:DUF429 domain-containing protein [Candidatus Hecatella orcuttiae]|uniref:DUF429 domain-containing protein n=1 Tax=Candidatus Hecatella orcuttiae TaxID=1935119 RepID=UPI00286815B6|nr:DUF429 domain-containing protein [Candidatus Hecatella orcuttiae]
MTASSRPVVGIDLAGVETRPTGFCTLDQNLRAKTLLLWKDEEIVSHVAKLKPRLVAVDAPLGLPKGRCCLRDDCPCRSAGHLRECDRELLRMGLKLFPPTLGAMRKLTLRAVALRKILERGRFQVVEAFPHAAKALLGFPEKREGAEKLREALKKFGVKGELRRKRNITIHELDAVVSALVGRLWLEGEAQAVGKPEEGLIIIPKKPQ